MSPARRLAMARAVAWRRLARIRRRFLPPDAAPVGARVGGGSTADPAGTDSATTTPLIVDYFGRDGSTTTMKLLSSAPEIVVPGSYPFEVDRLGGVLAANDPVAAWDAIAAGLPGTADTPPRFYAEKMIDLRKRDPGGLRLRTIVMLRDPRDTYVSIEAFSRAVGDEEIGGSGSRDRRLAGFVERQRERLDWIAGLGDDEATAIVRYEELAGDLEGTAARLSDWLGLALEPAAVGTDFRLRWVHGTSASPEQSIGRWRNELPDEVAGRIEGELGDMMAELGYDVHG